VLSPGIRPEASIAREPTWWEDRNIRELCEPGNLRFINEMMGVVTLEDPRLGELPLGWTQTVGPDGLPRWSKDDWDVGQATEFDPRLEIEALKERGVQIEDVILV
jgi:hypothetical protein